MGDNQIEISILDLLLISHFRPLLKKKLIGASGIKYRAVPLTSNSSRWNNSYKEYMMVLLEIRAPMSFPL